MNKIKKIVIFDFDATLVNTMMPEKGKQIWLEATGEEYPHIGWWGREESLNTTIFEHPLNKWVHDHYMKKIHEKNTSVFLVTGRREKVKHKVLEILDSHLLTFDDVFCNKGKDTYPFKVALFEKMIRDNPSVTEFIMYDDRSEHIIKFIEWMNTLTIKATLIDVITKEIHHN